MDGQKQLSEICKYIDSLENEKYAEFLFEMKQFLHDVSCVFAGLKKDGSIFSGKVFEGSSNSFGNLYADSLKYKLKETTEHECIKYTSIGGKCLNCGKLISV